MGSINKKSTFEIEEKSRTITVNNETIVISKLLNGGKEDYALRIDKIDEKDYNTDVNCKWYYCTSVKKDFLLGFTKAIVVVPRSGRSIYLFDFADEVTIFSHQFLIR